MGYRAMRSETVAAVPRTGTRSVAGAVEIVFFHDVLCAWSYIADQRLALIKEQYGSALTWRTLGFPLRPDEQAPDKKQRALFARHFKRAAKENEGKGVTADLWTGNDAPNSSTPPLLALEAARAQGDDAHDELLKALRQAAFLRGLNVARRDVLVELAESSGLDMPRFFARFDDPHTNDRVAKGVAGEWLMQGCREVAEYRDVIDRYMKERAGAPELRVIH